MNELLKQIKELEAQAKDAKYYKERYELLRQEVINLTDNLNQLMGASKKKHKTRNPERMKAIAEALYKKLQETDGLQIATKELTEALEENGYTATATKITQLRHMISEKPNVQKRVDGVKVFLFYFVSEQDKETMKIGDIEVPKKIKFMG